MPPCEVPRVLGGALLAAPPARAGLAALLALSVLAGLPAPAAAQAAGPRVLPALESSPAFERALARGTRGRGGAPGPAYWQQRVDYRIEATLDPASGRVDGHEVITYHNNSPDSLRLLVLHLEQNIFTEGAQRNRRAPVTGGVTLTEVRAGGVLVRPTHPGSGYYQQVTLAEVRLPAPLPPGAETDLEIRWSYLVPPWPAFRTGNLDGRLFAVAQWYPRLAVYDDVFGWNRGPYLGDGEFYLEYGDFDVRLTLPAGWLVGATGTLQNPAEVLSAEAAARLAALPTATGRTEVVDPEMVRRGQATRAAPGGSLTWHFTASDVRDFAWSASPDYVWDAVPAGAGRTAHALYRPQYGAWRRASDYAAHTVRALSAALAEYPYPQITIAEGPVTGMEYPMLVFNPSTDDPQALAGVTVHETTHQWFPMMVGSMEAKHPWMDEGFATYFEEQVLAELLRTPLPRWGETGSYLQAAGTEAEVPLMRHTDMVSPYGARVVAAYVKPAVALSALRAVVGDSVFTRAFRDYTRTWTFKHPQPWDFFNTVERHAGQDLDWFWRPLFFETGVLDHALGQVLVEGGRTVVQVEDQGEVILPTPVRVTLANGTVRDEWIGEETWLGARETRLVLQGEAVRVELDPEGLFPDVDESDDLWSRP